MKSKKEIKEIIEVSAIVTGLASLAIGVAAGIILSSKYFDDSCIRPIVVLTLGSIVISKLHENILNS